MNLNSARTEKDEPLMSVIGVPVTLRTLHYRKKNRANRTFPFDDLVGFYPMGTGKSGLPGVDGQLPDSRFRLSVQKRQRVGKTKTKVRGLLFGGTRRRMGRRG